jgi:hypothetical protein
MKREQVGLPFALRSDCPYHAALCCCSRGTAADLLGVHADLTMVARETEVAGIAGPDRRASSAFEPSQPCSQDSWTGQS